MLMRRVQGREYEPDGGVARDLAAGRSVPGVGEKRAANPMPARGRGASRRVVSVPANQVPDATAVAAGKRGQAGIPSRCYLQTSTTEVHGIRRSRPRVARRYE